MKLRESRQQIAWLLYADPKESIETQIGVHLEVIIRSIWNFHFVWQSLILSLSVVELELTYRWTYRVST